MGWFSRDPDARFWKWFGENQERLLGWQSDPHGMAEAVIKPLRKVDERLTFEFGPIVNGVGEFIVSADGNRHLFPVVERLVRAAPPLPRWRITAFRPRRPLRAMRIGERTVHPEDVRFIAYADSPHVGIVLLITGWTADTAE